MSLEAGPSQPLQLAETAMTPIRHCIHASEKNGTDEVRPRLASKKMIFRCHRSERQKPSTAEEDGQRLSKKAGCPFRVEVWFEKDEEGQVWVNIAERNGHYRHTPFSAEDVKFLPLTPEIENRIQELLEIGISPFRVLTILTKKQFAGMLNEREIATAAAGRLPTLRDIQNIHKRMTKDRRLGKNDAVGVAHFVEQLKSLPNAGNDDYILYYEHLEDNGKGEAEFQLAFSTPFLRDMLKCFGRKLVHLDAVWGSNRYGFPMLCLLVQDDFGNGVPVAFCITNVEDSERCARFIEAVFQAAELEPNEPVFMIDKSTIEIAAIKQIGGNYVLCIFHVLQEVERWARSSGSDMHGPENGPVRRDFMRRWQALSKIKDEAAFKVEEKEFIAHLKTRNLDKAADYYMKNWQDDAEFWAAWGRLEVEDEQSNTNNLLERFFGLFKYSFMQGKVALRLDDLVMLLLGTVVPHYLMDRVRKLRGGAESQKMESQRRYDRDVEVLSTNPSKCIIVDDTIGRAKVCSMSQPLVYDVVIGDGSCQCPASRNDVCKHAEAAMTRMHVSTDLLWRTAEYLNKNDVIECIEELPDGSKLYKSEPLAGQPALDGGFQKVYYYTNAQEWRCTCHYGVHLGCCAHLLAKLPAEDVDGIIEPAFCQGDSLVVQRARRLRTIDISPDEEPLNKYGIELGQVRTVVQAVGRKIDDPVVRDGNRILNKLKTIIPSLPPVERANLFAQAEALYDTFSLLVPKLAPTAKRAAKQERKHRARFPGRTSSSNKNATQPPRIRKSTTKKKMTVRGVGSLSSRPKGAQRPSTAKKTMKAVEEREKAAKQAAVRAAAKRRREDIDATQAAHVAARLARQKAAGIRGTRRKGAVMQSAMT